MLAGIVRIVFFFFIFSVVKSFLGLFMKKLTPPKQKSEKSGPTTDSDHNDIDVEYTVIKED